MQCFLILTFSGYLNIFVIWDGYQILPLRFVSEAIKGNYVHWHYIPCIVAILFKCSFETTSKTKTNVREKSRKGHNQAAADPRHEEEEETDKTKQAQFEQTYEKHWDKLSLPKTR